MNLHCDFEILHHMPDKIVIKDKNAGGKSVTNDVENVVSFLRAEGVLEPGLRLFYYDSQGDYAEICYDTAGFTGFDLTVNPDSTSL